ncbi:hypothetical protein F5144DRAFT_660626, partial [Chaetomium tenue]
MSPTRPEAPSSGAFIGKLRVLKAPAGFIPHGGCRPSTYNELKPENYEFRAVMLAIHLGLSMLESPRGLRIMAEMGVTVVKHHRLRRDPIRYRDNTVSMSEYAARFLDTLRHDFFNIYLTNNIRQVGGAAEAERKCSSPDTSPYDPKRDGGIKMSQMIIQNIANAARILKDSTTLPKRRKNALKNFRTGVFQMGFATAHELVHKWVGYLDCGHVLSLHWEMAPGCFWEIRFLGGRLLLYIVDRSDPLGVRQAGKIYLFKGEPGEIVKRARELDESYVQRILNFDFEHSARAASNAPLIRRPPAGDLMERVRASVVPKRFEFAFYPEQLDIMNRMEMYTVPAHVPNWLSLVR